VHPRNQLVNDTEALARARGRVAEWEWLGIDTFACCCTTWLSRSQTQDVDLIERIRKLSVNAVYNNCDYDNCEAFDLHALISAE
jgi:hypothetical protein